MIMVVDDVDATAQRLRAWTWRTDDFRFFREVATMGPVGASLLAAELRERTGWLERTLLVAALGDATGEDGIEELRQAAHTTGPHSTRMRCAAVLALAKRLGPDATPDLVEGLGDTSGTVRDYAMTCLATVGDDRAWEQVLSHFKQLLKRPATSNRDGSAFAYLAQHVDGDRILLLAQVLTNGWTRIRPEFKDLIINTWPDLFGERHDDEVALINELAHDWWRDGGAGLLDRRF